MAAYVARRLIYMPLTVIVLTAAIFSMLKLAVRADTVDLLVAQYGSADPELEQRIRKELRLDRTAPAQYVQWLSGTVRGDLGTSYFTKRTVTEELKRRFPVTAELGLLAMLLSVAFSVPGGVLAAIKRDSWQDYLLRGSSLLLYAVPAFWVGTLALALGGLWFHWAPPVAFSSLVDDPVSNLKLMLLPVIILALSLSASQLRLIRTQVLEVVRQDYVRTARAKGLPAHAVYVRHVLRNALLPYLTLIGYQLPHVLAGSVVLERLFSLPGIGSYFIESLTRLDYPVVLALNAVFGGALILTNLLIDTLYAVLDPRIRSGVTGAVRSAG